MTSTNLSHCSYVPSALVQHFKELYESKAEVKPPFRQNYQTAVLFADVSGFTNLSESLAGLHPDRGHELLHEKLNAYFKEIIKVIGCQGGDIFKFAGDAMIVLWPKSSKESLRTLVQRAGQCALQIKTQCQGFKIDVEGLTLHLNVKVGIGVGKISILHVGGIFNRLEYVPTGEALSQSFHAEHQANALRDEKQVVMSPEAYKLVKDIFHAKGTKEPDKLGKHYYYIQNCTQEVRKTSLRHIMSDILQGLDEEFVNKRVFQYEPAAVRPYVENFEETWAAESRDLTVLFVNLGISEKQLENLSTKTDLDWVHRILSTVQMVVYKYEGSINKFLMDDKGSTLIAVFGLPPLAHEDDPLRALFAAMEICTELRETENLYPSIGVTTGVAFCGIIGNHVRREYSILGDTVNLAARLMQHSFGKGGGVICDGATWHINQHDLKFTSLGKIQVKGKKKPVKIFHPYPKDHLMEFVRPPGYDYKIRTTKTPRAFTFSNVSSGSFNPQSMLNSEMKTSRDKLQGQTKLSQSTRQFEPPPFHEAVAHIDKKIRRALEYREGSAVFVQSEVGLGKTRLCARVHEMWKMRGDVNYTKAHGFNIEIPLGNFRQLCMDLIDPMGEADMNDIKKTLNRYMELAGIPINEMGVLNEIVSLVDFGMTREVREMKMEEKLDKCVEIFASAIITACKDKRRGEVMILIIDDAIFLNELSWKLVLKLVDAAPKLPLVLVVTTRPITATYCATYAKNPREWYIEALKKPASSYQQLEPLPDDVIYRIICQTLRVDDCPPDLAHFVIQEANGNPNIVRDFLYLLEEKEGIFTVEAGVVIIRESGVDWGELMWNVRCPRSVRLLMARQIDRLSHKASIMLKIGALVGERFPYWVIEAAYPLKDKEGIWEEFKAMVDLNILNRDNRRGSNPCETEMYGKGDYFTFANRLMANLLRSRTVVVQGTRLRKAINTARITYIKEVAEEARKSALEEINLRVNYSLYGQNLGEHRAVIARHGLYLYKSEQDWKEGKLNSIKAYADLVTCVVQHSEPSSIVVETHDWMHDGKLKNMVGKIKLESLPEGRPFPRVFLKRIREINASFEAHMMRKKKSMARIKDKYNRIQDQKSHRDYSEDEKHKMESTFRSDVIWALRRVEKDPLLVANCMVLKKERFLKLGNWKKRTVVLTKVGLLFFDVQRSPLEIRDIIPKTMVCLQTHNCRVTTRKPSNFKIELNNKYPHVIYLVSLLWAKAEKMHWQQRLFVIAFDTKEAQELWSSKIRSCINSFHHGEAGNSKLAGLYRSGRKLPRFSSSPISIGTPMGSITEALIRDSVGGSRRGSTRTPEQNNTPSGNRGGGSRTRSHPSVEIFKVEAIEKDLKELYRKAMGQGVEEGILKVGTEGNVKGEDDQAGVSEALHANGGLKEEES
ncbi:hypothetical protein AAMO2058_001048700 [Amorphochlora amoebiformis]